MSNRADQLQGGSLVVVGTGIKAISQITIEAQSTIEHADKVLYLVPDPLTAAWIASHNDSAESLYRFYDVDKDRNDTYREMVERVLTFVREGRRVCAIFYGHPGVFSTPGHECIRVARHEGYEASMLPGVSSLDCLFADLGFDPGVQGCQSFEATDFLIHRRPVDTSSPLVLWQIGVIGEWSLPTEPCNRAGLTALAGALVALHGHDHAVTIYEAAQAVTMRAHVSVVPLSDLASSNVTPISTLYVPPSSPPQLDQELVEELFGKPASTTSTSTEQRNDPTSTAKRH